MKYFKLSRRGKTLRNILLILLVLFVIAWENDFPSLTKAGLLRRAERLHLLTPGAVIVEETADLDGGVLIAKHGDQTLRVEYDHTLVGLRLERAELT